MTDFFDGLRELMLQYNLLGMGTNLIGLAIIILSIMATNFKYKDKALVFTVSIGLLLLLGILKGAVIVFIGMVGVIITVILQLRGDNS